MNDSHNVVDLGEYRYRLANSRPSWRSDESCEHKHLVLDENGATVECEDCEKQVGTFWAFAAMVRLWQKWLSDLKSKQYMVQQDANATLHLRAAKRAERAWRSRSMVPCCPHCGEGISAMDGFGGSQISKELDQRRRNLRKQASEGIKP